MRRLPARKEEGFVGRLRSLNDFPGAPNLKSEVNHLLARQQYGFNFQ
jgi:hypothetical protein